jgi:hypothetical protein
MKRLALEHICIRRVLRGGRRREEEKAEWSVDSSQEVRYLH